VEKVIERLSLIEPRNPGCKAQIEEVYLTPLRVSELHVNIADSFSQEHHEKLLPYNDICPPSRMSLAGSKTSSSRFVISLMRSIFAWARN